MLLKTPEAMVPSDYRPIANVRVLDKMFAYPVFGRIEHTLDNAQPEEQHGFRKNRRMEERLATINYVFDKTVLISLDLSEVSNRINWQALWTALATHDVSQQSIYFLHLFYKKQRGQVLTYTARSCEFDIHRGVKKGCVLSPGLLCADRLLVHGGCV